mgnify:CR=1 FL=1
MTAEIISVGTELLLGNILNTNAQYLSRELAELGITVQRESTIGDNQGRLADFVNEAKSRCDLLVFTGGLGPTADDLTKETVAACYGDTLVFDESEWEKIIGYFARSGRVTTPNNRKQAMVPVKGHKIINHHGTAPGAWFEQEGRCAVLMPGVPSEMKAMWNESVRPLLMKRQNCTLHSVTLRVLGGESSLEYQVRDLLENANPTAAVYAKTAEVVIRITAKAASENEARRMCLDYAKHFYDILGDCVYAMDADSLEEVVVKELAARGLTVATAESCTGGMLSQRITAVPGASGVFAYGACTYANDIKEKMLGVRHETLEAYGAVSPETAAEMARGVRKAAGADFVGAEDLVAKIQGENWFGFDVVVATPDMMGVVGRLGKVLGPKGLMPNPKAGTVTMDVTKAIEELKAGKIEYRLDKTNIIHCPLGKASFGAEKLQENYSTLYDAVLKAKPAAAKGQYMKSIIVTSTMGPGIKINPAKA